MSQHGCELADGRTLAWYEFGEGPPLVLLHGWSLSGLAFAELAGLLSSRFRVLCPDLPGHGRSTLPAQVSFAGLAADLRQWLDNVVTYPVCLAGWSLGGMLAMELADQDTSSLAGLVLIGTTPRFTQGADWSHGLPTTQLKVLQRNLGREYEATLAGFFNLTFAGEKVSRQRLQEIRRFAIYPGQLPSQPAAAAMLDLLATQDQRALLPRLKLPVIIIHGDLDQITPPGAAAYLQQMLPQARLELVAGCGHAPFWSQPARAAALIEECATWFR